MKATLEQVLEDLENDMTVTEIADKYGYKTKSSISSKIRDKGYNFRPSISKSTGGYSDGKYAGVISIPYRFLKDYDPLPYYQIKEIESKDEDGLKIVFKDSRVYREDEEQ